MTFWDDPHPLVLTGSEMRVLFSGAVRYAMHRGTFASKETAEAVRRHIREIDEGTLEIIARDIEWDTRRSCAAGAGGSGTIRKMSWGSRTARIAGRR